MPRATPRGMRSANGVASARAPSKEHGAGGELSTGSSLHAAKAQSFVRYWGGHIMAKRILVTGGAGFIGSHLVDELLAHGHSIRVLDNLTPRVHHGGRRPAYLNTDAELVIGDVRDGALSSSTLKEASSWGKVDTVYEQMVFAEATLALPLIVGYAYHKGSWKARKGKKWATLLERELATA